jgi:hypothetical protein
MNLKSYMRHGEAASADLTVIEEEQEHIRKLIEERGYELQDIFNMDETGLFYACLPLIFLLMALTESRP